MDATAQKLDLIRWITELKDTSTLNVLEIIKEQSLEEGCRSTGSDAEKASIEKGLAEAKEGKVISHSEVKKRYEKWLND